MCEHDEAHVRPSSKLVLQKPESCCRLANGCAEPCVQDLLIDTQHLSQCTSRWHRGVRKRSGLNREALPEGLRFGMPAGVSVIKSPIDDQACQK